MLTLLSITLATLTLTNLKRWKWTSFCCSFSLMTLLSINLYKNNTKTWKNLSFNLGTDKMSTPLMILSCWLAPLCFLAKKNLKLNKKIKKTFLMLITSIMFFLMLTFSSMKMLSFFMCFEATLIPTLILMTRLGKKVERLQAGLYFLFYTLMGSLPLLISMLLMKWTSMSTKFPMKTIHYMKNMPKKMNKMWWSITIMAFLMKMPIYGFHLWLPKAHVEAPVAGSMMLAAILLKLGGYGLMRVKNMFSKMKKMKKMMMMFCCWGALVVSMLCLRQTDLKALIAYSSMSHMSMTAAGIFMFSQWSMSGTMMMMMAHGLVSSALFALAKILYERSHTRKMFITRGFKTMTIILPMWWLLSCAANLGLPPFPNLMGELIVLSSLIGWSIYLLPLMSITTMFNAMFSLTMFSSTKKNKNFYNSKMKTMKSREHLLMVLHLLPLIPMMMKPSSCLTWFK